MLVSFVVDASIASRDTLDNITERQNLEALLNSLLENALLLDTPDEAVFAELKASILKLAETTVKAQKLGILWAEVAKNRGRCVFACPKQMWPTQPPSDLEGTLTLLATKLNADGIVIASGRLPLSSATVPAGTEVIPVPLYLDSSSEARRRRYENPRTPLDLMSEAERDDLIRGAIRYANEISFYDRMIGEGTSLGRFHKGIEYIVTIWCQHRVIRTTNPVVRIITKAGSGGRGIPRAGLEETGRKILAKLCRPLLSTCRVSVYLEVKQDPNDKFHARHIACAHGAFQIERGFDLFLERTTPAPAADSRSGSNAMVRNFIRRDSAAEPHLRELRALKTVFSGAA